MTLRFCFPLCLLSWCLQRWANWGKSCLGKGKVLQCSGSGQGGIYGCWPDRATSSSLAEISTSLPIPQPGCKWDPHACTAFYMEPHPRSNEIQRKKAPQSKPLIWWLGHGSLFCILRCFLSSLYLLSPAMALHKLTTLAESCSFWIRWLSKCADRGANRVEFTWSCDVFNRLQKRILYQLWLFFFFFFFSLFYVKIPMWTETTVTVIQGDPHRTYIWCSPN